MRKRPSRWPTDRSLFRDTGKRGVLATWAICALSIAAAVVLVGYLRYPDL